MLGGAVGRAVVVGEVVVGDAEVESAARDRPLLLEGLFVAEVVPVAEREDGQVEARAAAAAVLHFALVAVGGGGVSHPSRHSSLMPEAPC
jgi:hypothetical protein